MGIALHRFEVDEALEKIEESVLPSLTALLDSLIDAAAFCRPGSDAEAHAEGLRAMAAQLEAVTREMEAIAPAPLDQAALEAELRIPA